MKELKKQIETRVDKLKKKVKVTLNIQPLKFCSLIDRVSCLQDSSFTFH